MSFKEITKAEIKDHLHQVGIETGDHLVIHSALHMLGKSNGGIGVYLEVVREVLGDRGTIMVPTFCWDFAHGKKYGLRRQDFRALGRC